MRQTARKLDLDSHQLPQSAEARLHPPPLQPGWAHRTALINRLRADHAPLVVLAAPAGYGKTTLLTQWSLRDARPFAWLRLLPGDGKPIPLLRGLVESLSRLAPVDDAIALPLGARPLRVEAVTRQLGRWLLERPDPFVLVVDNANLLERGSEGILKTLADHLPPGSRLAISGREVPALTLARRRAHGLVEEIGADDLRFTDREAATLFAVAGVDLVEADCDDLNERAEGWPAGLALAALALERRQGHPTRSAASFAGDHHYVSEFFDSEVLSVLAPEDAEFATHVSLIDRLSGPACDDLLEVHGSGARLERLARDGAFLVPLDRERREFRFQTFFRETLRTRLEQREPDRFVELSLRAAAAAEREGDFVAAMDFLRRIGDRDGAMRVLGAAAPEVFGNGLLVPLEPSLVDLADDALLAGDQAAAATGALAHSLLGHSAVAARWTAAADAAAVEGASESLVDALHAVLCRDGAERMLEDAAAAADGVEERSPLASFALLLQGVAQVLRGHADAAEPILAEAVDRATSGDSWLVLALGQAELAMLAHEAGDVARTEELVVAARDAADKLDEDNAVVALVYVVSARSALRNSNWVRVSDDLEHLHALLPRLTEALPWLSGQVRIELARTHLALNDLPAVRELLAELDILLLARPHLGVLREQVAALHAEVERLLERSSGANHSLTAAELRLLPLLTTHLTFRQIGDHLYVSRNTIKTQAISVYRKLGVTSRAEAIKRAHELGFLRNGDAA